MLIEINLQEDSAVDAERRLFLPRDSESEDNGTGDNIPSSERTPVGTLDGGLASHSQPKSMSATADGARGGK